MNLFEIPKADLHVHLDGSLRIESLINLAQDYSIKLPSQDPEQLTQILGFKTKYHSLEDCLNVFNLTTSLMQTEGGLYQITYELIEDASKENIKYMEIRFAPHLHTNNGLSYKHILDSVITGIKDGSEVFGTETKLIICGIRNLSPELSKQMAELAVSYKQYGIVGFDLAGAESGFPPSLHKEAIDIARNGGLGITIHAGESAGPEYIKEALDLGATRIGHGCRILEDEGLIKRALENNVILECCPTSNWQTGAVKNLSEHPLKKCLELGLKVTVNTDNRLIHNTMLTKELDICYSDMKLSEQQILTIIQNGFEAKFKNN